MTGYCNSDAIDRAETGQAPFSPPVNNVQQWRLTAFPANRTSGRILYA